MVVVAVRPPGNVDLPGGDTAGAQGAHQQDGFLPAPPPRAPERVQRGVRPVVGGRIFHGFGAPEVDRLHGGLHGLTGNPFPELRPERLVIGGWKFRIDPGEQNVSPEDVLRNGSAPGNDGAHRSAVPHDASQRSHGDRHAVAFRQSGAKKG